MAVDGYVCVYILTLISFSKAESFLGFTFISRFILTSAQGAFLLFVYIRAFEKHHGTFQPRREHFLKHTFIK